MGQESRSWKPMMWKVVIHQFQRPWSSLCSCYVLHKDHSPEWALGPIRNLLFCLCDYLACFDDCVDLVELSGDSASKGWNFRLKTLARSARIGPTWVLWSGRKVILDFIIADEIFILKLYTGSFSCCYKKCFQQVVLFRPRDLNFELSSVSSCLGSKLPSTGEDIYLNNTHNKCYQSRITTDKQAAWWD